jgi:hypothetical protein
VSRKAWRNTNEMEKKVRDMKESQIRHMTILKDKDRHIYTKKAEVDGPNPRFGFDWLIPFNPFYQAVSGWGYRGAKHKCTSCTIPLVLCFRFCLEGHSRFVSNILYQTSSAPISKAVF